MSRSRIRKVSTSVLHASAIQLCNALCKGKQSTLCIATREMDARTAYETFLRKRVSDTHWSSVKRTLTDSGMEINSDTVVFSSPNFARKFLEHL
jgi:hypothetical protein